MRVNCDSNDGTVAVAREWRQLSGIIANLLIPGRGKPMLNGAVIIDGVSILWTGPLAEMPPAYKSASFIHVPVLLPGLWDAHTHYLAGHVLGDLGFSSRKYLVGSPALIGAIAVDDLRATLMAGFTSVRELGGCAGDIRPAIDAGLIVGPNVYSSTKVLSIVGGHGDDHVGM